MAPLCLFLFYRTGLPGQSGPGAAICRLTRPASCRSCHPPRATRELPAPAAGPQWNQGCQATGHLHQTLLRLKQHCSRIHSSIAPYSTGGCERAGNVLNNTARHSGLEGRQPAAPNCAGGPRGLAYLVNTS